MCLHRKFIGKEKKNFFKNLPDEEYITVYKVVRKEGGKYFPMYYKQGGCFEAGVNQDKQKWYRFILTEKSQFYRAGFHFYVDLSSTKHEKYVLECKIKKEWITAVGYDFRDQHLTVITGKAIFPEEGETK